MTNAYINGYLSGYMTKVANFLPVLSKAVKRSASATGIGAALKKSAPAIGKAGLVGLAAYGASRLVPPAPSDTFTKKVADAVMAELSKKRESSTRLPETLLSPEELNEIARLEQLGLLGLTGALGGAGVGATLSPSGKKLERAVLGGLVGATGLPLAVLLAERVAGKRFLNSVEQ